MIRLEGFGLHGGRPAAIVLRAAPGPTTLGRGADRATLPMLSMKGGDRATTATLPSGATLASVEHMLAAIAGLGLFHGLSVDVVEGDELPLFDGCATAMVQALDTLGIVSRSVPAARVLRAGDVQVGDATYAFRPSVVREIAVDIAFDESRFGRALAGRAAWNGDASSFRTEVAPSRTFGAARELEALRARGLAAHVPVGAVVALDLDDPAWAPRDLEEPIRHKLLDLIGDLARLGAPLEGILRARRPSHRASSEALDRAIEQGLIALP